MKKSVRRERGSLLKGLGAGPAPGSVSLTKRGQYRQRIALVNGVWAFVWWGLVGRLPSLPPDVLD